jgi:hypothetical protein
MVPKPLVRLRLMLIHAKGLETSGIFRTLGASWEVQSLTSHVQKGTYYVCTDAHAIATCIKNHLRMLPPLFSKIPQESIDNPKNVLQELKSAGLDSTELDLVMWLIDMMLQVTLAESKTGMNARSIGKNYIIHCF